MRGHGWLRTATATAALVAAAAHTAQAAYVQKVQCLGDFPQQQLVDELGLDARLEHFNVSHDRLSLGLFALLPAHGCDRWAAQLGTITLRLATLGRDDAVSHHNVSQNCHERAGQGRGSYVALQSDYPAFPDLSTFQLALQFMDNTDSDVVGACLRSRATPQPSVLLLAVLRYIPMAILALVIITGIIRSIPSPPAPLRLGGDSDRAEEEEDEEPPPRPILPDVGDCLQYLQFVFLTACLSLQYPGFYQPAVSELRWYSLFGTTLWVETYAYQGYSDGIYEINGTFGGTYGAELMTQVVGAPLTIGTWVNMVICVAIAAIAIALLLSALWLLQVRKALLGIPDLGSPGWKPLASNVVKVIMSYFMLPVIALTVYQLDYASLLPISHSAFAVFLLAAMLAAFAWLVWQIPTRSLGALLFDPSKRYHRLQQQPDSPDGFRDSHSNNNGNRRGQADSADDGDRAAEQRRDQIFVYTLFLTMFLRAAIIGGLQLSGLAQVVALFCCEFLFAAYIVGMQAYALVSLGSFAAGVRVITVGAMIVFLPDTASDGPRDLVAYALLGLNASFLVFGFGGSAVYQLVSAAARSAKRERSREVYGLRDLQRRPHSRNALDNISNYPRDQDGDLRSPHPGSRLDLRSIGGSDSTVSLPSGSPGLRSPAITRGVRVGHMSPTPRADSPSDLRLDSLRSSEPRNSLTSSIGGNNYYFRPPRSSTYSPSLTSLDGKPRHLRSQQSLNRVSGTFPSSPLSPGGGLPGVSGTAMSRHSVAAVQAPGPANHTRASAEQKHCYGDSNSSSSKTTSPSSSTKRNIRGVVRHSLPPPPTARDQHMGIRVVAPEDEKEYEDDDDDNKNKKHVTNNEEDRSSLALGPRWNDYSFREADLIYGGPDEGEYEAARARYDQGPAPTTPDLAGRSSINTLRTTSTVASSSTNTSGRKSTGEDSSSADADERRSRLSDDIIVEAAPGILHVPKSTGKKSRLSQLRQFSSSKLLAVGVGMGVDKRLSSSSSSSAAVGAAASGESPEQGFSVRRPPRPPEHVVRAMQAAVRAQQVQEQQEAESQKAVDEGEGKS